MRKMGSMLLAAALCSSVWAAEPQPSWELRDGGRWQQVGAPTTAPIQDETLDRIEEMLQNKQATAGKKIVVAWLRANKDSPIRDRSLYLLGQANYLAGNRIMSFYNFDELLDTYPSSRYYYPALERQYDIADAYLRGYRNRFLGMPIFTAEEEATEMLYRIQQRAPGSPLAEKSLLRVADFYYSRADFDLAADAYGAYVRAYPRSPYLPRVRLRQAFATLAQFRGVKFDATPVIDARQQLVDLAATYPRIAEEENLAAILARVDAALARKLLETADFYRRTRKSGVAGYYYRYLVRTYPNSTEARTAEESLKRLPSLESTPRVVPQTRPATRPTTGPASPTNRESR